MSKAYGHLGNRPMRDGTDMRSRIMRLSKNLQQIERVAAGVVLLMVFGVVLFNVVRRVIGDPVIWADELAIYGMAWAAFIGASAGLGGQDHIAITLLSDKLGALQARLLAKAVDVILLILFVSLILIVWRWFDPFAYFSAATPDDYAAATFNFMHQEPTTTLGIRKVWVWLILPVFCVTGTIHVAARLFGGAVR